MRYTITITNTGSAAATLSQVTDTIVAQLAFDANLVTGLTAAACSSSTGTPENAAGRGFKLDVTGDTRGGAYPKFFTTANDADGADLNAGAITINYATAMPAEAGYRLASCASVNRWSCTSTLPCNKSVTCCLKQPAAQAAC